MLSGKKLRVARPTDRLAEVVHFYTEGLGLQILDRFDNHEATTPTLLTLTCAAIVCDRLNELILKVE